MSEPTPSIPVRPPPPEALSPGVLVPCFVLLIVVGYFLFTRGIGVPAGNELTKHQSVMVAVNAATLTGFQQARNPADYTPAGQAITLGLMVGGTLFSLIGGGLAVVRIARLPFRDGAVAVVAVASVVVVGAAGAVLGPGPGRTAFDGAYQAISAWGNCGLFTGRLPAGKDAWATGGLLPLAVLGSLGLPVLMDGVDAVRKRRSPSTHAVRTLTAWAAVYLLTVAVLWPLMAVAVGPHAAAGLTASREAVNARSAGFPFQFVTYLPPSAVVVVLLAMLIGGGAGGTAGGLKVTTLATLAGGAWDAVRGRPTGRAFGLAVAWVAAYAGLVVATTLGLVLADPDLPADRVLFLAASAVGNVGLSHDPVSASTAGIYVLSVAMLLGRVLPVLLLWTIADRMPDVTEPIG